MPKKCKLIFSSHHLCQGYFGWIKTTGNVYIANLNLNRKFPWENRVFSPWTFISRGPIERWRPCRWL